MRPTSLLPALVLLAALGSFARPPDASAQSSGFRCPRTGRIVSAGARPSEVVLLCGVPDFQTRRVEVHRVRETLYSVPDSHPRDLDYELSRAVEITIDEWTYDFGPSRFVRHLIFVNGRLYRVEDGPYGKKLDWR